MIKGGVLKRGTYHDGSGDEVTGGKKALRVVIACFFYN